MTWEIVTGLIVLIGCAISVGTIVYKLANILTKLESAIESLRETISIIKLDNADEHARIFKTIESLENKVTEIEIQLKLFIAGGDSTRPNEANH